MSPRLMGNFLGVVERDEGTDARAFGFFDETHACFLREAVAF